MAHTLADVRRLIRKAGIDLDSRQQSQLDRLTEAERELFIRMTENVVSELREVDGGVRAPRGDVVLNRAIDSVFNAVQNTNVKGVFTRSTKDFEAMVTNANAIYKGYGKTNERRYVQIEANVREQMRKTLGYKQNGQMVEGAYLDRLFRNPGPREKVKQTVFSAVTSGKSMTQLQKELNTQIMGSPSVDGILAKYYKTFVFDTYTKADRVANDEYAQRLGLKHFIYAGGLIETSRKFCVDRNNKVFTTEEAAKWAEDPDLPKSAEERDTGTVVGYVPTQDLGRWNCRHSTNYITKELAEELRPDLAGKQVAESKAKPATKGEKALLKDPAKATTPEAIMKGLMTGSKEDIDGFMSVIEGSNIQQHLLSNGTKIAITDRRTAEDMHIAAILMSDQADGISVGKEFIWAQNRPGSKFFVEETDVLPYLSGEIWSISSHQRDEYKTLATLLHEIGHTYQTTPAQRSILQEHMKNQGYDLKNDSITKYGETNISEWWAESFTAYSLYGKRWEFADEKGFNVFKAAAKDYGIDLAELPSFRAPGSLLDEQAKMRREFAKGAKAPVDPSIAKVLKKFDKMQFLSNEELIDMKVEWGDVYKKVKYGKDAAAIKDLDGLVDYTGQGYRRYNMALRDGEEGALLNKAKRISDFVGRHSSDKDLVAQRSINIGDANVRSLMMGMSPGKVFEFKGMVSTTLHSRPVDFFGPTETLRMRIFMPKGTPGAFVEPITTNMHEWEFVLPHGTKARVLRVNNAGSIDEGGVVIDVEVILP